MCWTTLGKRKGGGGKAGGERDRDPEWMLTVLKTEVVEGS